ncbi:hypothetical protein BPC006_I1506 [Burkholderia pseudomallei BPC006]|nr:hypothetical protein BPC006_I1506 [Burkholderia pseudomallei BPC006]
MGRKRKGRHHMVSWIGTMRYLYPGINESSITPG